MLEWTRGQALGELDTPALILDIAAAERNIRAMADRLVHGSVRLRPHVKTHKCPLLAHKQMAAGAIGVTAAKLGEAEVMIRAGIPEVLVSTPIVGRTKIERLIALSRHGLVLTVVDDAGAARAISDAATRAGLKIPALVDVDVGQRRTGVLPGEPALALARQVATMPGLVLVGLQGYEGHLQHVQSRDERERLWRASMKKLTDTADLVRGAGFPLDIVSTGGTGTSTFALEATGITEIQPGSYVVMDDHYGTVQGVGFEQALFVLTTVVSRTRTTDVIVDAGMKALSSDSGPPRVRGIEGAQYTFAGDEHGRIEFVGEGSDLRVGDKVLLVPSHCDTTINLHDHYHVIEDDRLVEVLPIAARGRIR
ncbi:DSD1 family PLP-dependent enzyme [Polyangium sp. 15x6]|uniref:DSD1 family PLP-dependent enzyme n=1 Tax=Polyangium sp. 15x6 TaxID=3042687 RepID=UPI00249AE0A5|nr:DSD1 family PLP-dependent enzyme [Polyangium sp. 15x6]MDI3288066.1 DSD1 family PLP-dependent enzyme [Polyangium sp. 15x6]